MMETALVYSVVHKDYETQNRPFRSPHHSSSPQALVGGGRDITPGEISFAHNGILFLDELPEFSKRTLEMLREPMESFQIRLSRVKGQVTFPAKFQLIAAMNPCPYGVDCSEQGQACYCSPQQQVAYQQKLSKPLLDRIDIKVKLKRISVKDFSLVESEINQEQLCQKIKSARDCQFERQGKLNYCLNMKEINQFCVLSSSLKVSFDRYAEDKQLSPREYFKLIRLMRSLADLEGKDQLTEAHFEEALFFRYDAFIKPRY